VVVTNPDRVLFPDVGVTKGEVARYWERVAPLALPLLVDRPLTLVRCPQGIHDCFFQKHGSGSMPKAVPLVRIVEKSGEPKPEPYMMVDGLHALMSLVQFGALEFHPWASRADRLERPDFVVLDVDPGPDVGWSRVVQAAFALRALLRELGMSSWPKATGGKGLHVVLPIARRSSWEEVGAFARGLAQLMAAGAPDHFVATPRPSARRGRIDIDHLRNVRNANAVAAFSPRARAGAYVAYPMTWDEVEASVGPPLMNVREANEVDWAARDPWSGYASARQSITRSSLAALRPGRRL
jgi:bifunctional non-homologous end joining protein LigD